mgnify:CR=1 FL=1
MNDAPEPVQELPTQTPPPPAEGSGNPAEGSPKPAEGSGNPAEESPQPAAPTVAAEAVQYLNRLSDLLFVVARVLARHENGTEVIWRAQGRD